MIRRVSIILVILVLILILAVGVAPFVFGIKAENAYSKWVEHWAEVTNLRVVSKKYHRGWFSSYAETTYEYSKGNTAILTLSEYDYVVHGPIALKAVLKPEIEFEPFLARIKTEVRGQPKDPSELADMLKLLPPLEIDTVFSFQSTGTSNISMQPFSYRHENLKEFLNWKGISGNSSLVNKGDKLRVDLNFPGLDIMDEDFSLSFNNGEIDFDSEYEENKVSTRHDSISIKIKNIEIRNFSLSSDEVRILSLDDLESSWSSVVKNGLINGSQKIEFYKLIFNESSKFGPGALEFSFNNIPLDAFHEINKAIDMLGGEVITTQPMLLTISSIVMRYLPQLADHHAGFEVRKLSLNTRDGEFMANAKVYIQGAGSKLKLNPFSAIEAINAAASVTVPKGVLEPIIKGIAMEEIKDAIKQRGGQMPDDDGLSSMAETAAKEKVDGLLKLNILVLDDENYELKLAYSKGILDLNGKSVPIPLLSP